MNLARVFTAAAACVVFGADLAACSGSFGSGSGLPQTMGTLSPGNPTPSPTPSSTSVILTVGESTAFQSIPEIGGYSAQLAFPKVAPETKAPSAKGSDKGTPAAAPTPVAISIGATLSVTKPSDGPDLNFESGKGRKKRTREHPARALAYITLLPTHDVTLESFPRLILDVPREVASQYRDGEFGLALWNSGEKDSKYRLAVAELDKSATPPPSVIRAVAAATPAASGSPAAVTAASPTAASTASPPSKAVPPGLSGTAPVTGPSAPGGVASPGTGGPVPSAAPTLPPAHILFAGTATQLKLVANRPAVFAVYALPHPAAAAATSASPGASAAAASHGAAAATHSASPSPNAGVSPSAKSETSASSAPATPASNTSPTPASSTSPTSAPTKAP
jgi:hypothetical protein